MYITYVLCLFRVLFIVLFVFVLLLVFGFSPPPTKIIVNQVLN